MKNDNTKIIDWRKIGGDDRSKSVYDYLFELRTAVDPLDILCEQLENEKPAKNGTVSLRIGTSLREARVARMQLELLLDDHQAVGIRKVEDRNGADYYLEVDQPTISAIRHGINTIDIRATQVANTFKEKGIEASEPGRLALRGDLADAGLIVTIKSPLLNRLENTLRRQFDASGNQLDANQHLGHTLNHRIKEFIERNASGLQPLDEETKQFDSVLLEIADDIYDQRRNHGRTRDLPGAMRHVPDDFLALLEGALSQRAPVRPTNFDQIATNLQMAAGIPQPPPKWASSVHRDALSQIHTGKPEKRSVLDYFQPGDPDKGKKGR